MKAFLKKYIFQKWWFPILLFLISSLFFMMLLASTKKILLFISDYFLLFTFILLLIAGFWQLFRGKWYLGLLQLGALFVGFVILVFVSTFMMMFGPDTDTFADNLKLPENVKLAYPTDVNMRVNFERIRLDSMQNNVPKEISFQLYNSFQPGLYEYDLWLKSNESGTIFLKAFEITQEIELSVPRLQKRSSISISNTNGKIKKFGTVDNFTIYEGDWGKPYGARFEVWFTPDDGNKSRKLYEKNYVIEGWMR
ncbi:hypothetical protein U8527_08005 [Kordia algicida OT-1]|uniref:Uncharacterized protein n=1 Tax=Kordia algicida OT-1 TaxID=391587 RepID=A9E920_9FLAO|nr:hypothetical protein [Kordia algicida]EDP94847.1 hypothetical protein KAOT1_01435 [Kordia algicida OT-1]